MCAQRLRLLVVLVGGLLLVSSTGTRVCAQPDSVRAAILTQKGFSPDHSPQGALWRSAVVPGWGQFYNQQYYKIPFVYAGLALLGIRIYNSHQDYLLYKRAHLFGRGPQLAEAGEPNPYQQYESQYNRVVEQLGGERLRTMRTLRDQYRRRRDLSILGTGLFYALTLLDAYVSAHLLTFDIGDELSVRVHPTGPLPGRDPFPTTAYTGSSSRDAGAGLRVRLQF